MYNVFTSSSFMRTTLVLAFSFGTGYLLAEPDNVPAPERPLQRYTLTQPDIQLVGDHKWATSTYEDTLIDIASRELIGYNLIRTANPMVDAWLPGEGTPVLLPGRTILPNAPKEGIVINAPEMRLYYYSAARKGEPASVSIFSVSVGRGEWSTPVTKTRVTGRVKNPVWYPPETIRAEHAARGDKLPKRVEAGPDNPLGQYLLQLGIPSYFIHGTNKKFGIGMQVTHGCIRMYPQDIELLASLVPNGTPVTIVNQVAKAGWLNGELFLEVHPPLETAQGAADINPTEVVRAVVEAAENYPAAVIDWERIDTIIKLSSGLPEKIGYLPEVAALENEKSF